MFITQPEQSRGKQHGAAQRTTRQESHQKRPFTPAPWGWGQHQVPALSSPCTNRCAIVWGPCNERCRSPGVQAGRQFTGWLSKWILTDTVFEVLIVCERSMGCSSGSCFCAPESPRSHVHVAGPALGASLGVSTGLKKDE